MQVDLGDRSNRLTHWATVAWKPFRDGWICANLRVARLGSIQIQPATVHLILSQIHSS